MSVSDNPVPWRKRPRTPLPVSLGILSEAEHRLNVHMWSIPAHGHYMTLKGIATALAARRHNVSWVICDQNIHVYEQDGLSSLGIGRISAGRCPIYEQRDEALREYIAAPQSLEAIGHIMEGVAMLAREMCETVMPLYAEGPASRPDIIVFDADTFCAMDAAVAWQIPRVARVGTSIRDAYTQPLYVPSYGQAVSIEMGIRDRLLNAALAVVNRLLAGPIVLPHLMARDRLRWISYANEKGFARSNPPSDLPVAERLVAAHYDESRLAPELPWDCVPVLYNSHWGLEHARPLMPYEHMVGHTTDFQHEASKPIPRILEDWLQAAPDVPVVYVALGTLSVVNPVFLARLAEGFTQAARHRFLWSVAKAQQPLLPASVQEYTRRWHNGSSNGVPPAAGDVLLVDWAPQLAILMHNMTQIFLSHGGMNGVAEATYAHTPLLCVPLFSDQPDNCAHAADAGFAAIARPADIIAHGLNTSLLDDLEQPSVQASIHTAWVRNVAAGGLPRAVSIVESTAAAGYWGHLHTIPRYHFQPWWQSWNLDVVCLLLLLLCTIAWCIGNCWKRCCRKSRVASRDKRE